MPPVSITDTEAPEAWPSSSTRAVHQFHEYQQQRQTAFNAFRPITTQLLLLRDQPEQLHPQLVSLKQLLQELPAEGVEGCWDYVAFPLMVLLDAVVPTRKTVRSGCGAADSTDGSGDGVDTSGRCGAGELLAAACRSDRVVEALLGALLILLVRSTAPDSVGGSGAQRKRGEGVQALDGLRTNRLVAVLQHLAPLLQLGSEEASEEVHVALQRCLSATLEPLAVRPAASAQQGSAAVASMTASPSNGGVSGDAVLCSEQLTPLAGYLLHCCLEVAEREILTGRKGSKVLCTAALSTLGTLLAALPDPDVQAFFLPGVVSGLSKHLYAAGSATAHSGPSAPPGAAAVVQALVCLRTALISVLSDEAMAAILGPKAIVVNVTAHTGASLQPQAYPSEVHSADDALSALRKLSLSSSSTAADEKAAAAGLGCGAETASFNSSAANITIGTSNPHHRRRFRVDRTLEWLEETSARVNSLLGRTLPPLCSHPRPAVRAELGGTVAALVDYCGRALLQSQPLLLRLLFTLAQDEWGQVGVPCQKWLARQAHLASAAATAPGAVAQSGAGPAQALPSHSAPDSTGVGGLSGTSSTGTCTGSGAGRGPSGGAGSRHEGLKALEDEFESFMRGLMSESVLLEQPALEMDTADLDDGSGEGAGGHDKDALIPPPTREDVALVELAPPAAIATSGHAPSPPTPAVLPGLQSLIAESATAVHLLHAVRSGEAEIVVQARCLTTALLMAGPGRIAEWLLLRPAALEDLLTGLFRCFAFDRNAATLVLHLRGEAGSYAPSLAATARGSYAARAQVSETMAAVAAAGAKDAAAVALAGGASAAAELPRMPLCLLYLASQRSYMSLAAVARSLGRLARAADSEAANAAACKGPASSVLRRLMDVLGTAFRRAVTRGAAGAGDGAPRQHRVSDWESSGADDNEHFESAAAAPITLENERGRIGVDSWQCEAAAVAVVAAEVVIGASNAWVAPLGTPQAPEAGTVAEPQSQPFLAADPVFESTVLGLLQDLMRPGITKLPTHNSDGAFGRHAANAAAAAGAPLSYDDVVHPNMATQRNALAAQTLGENVMLLRAVLEALGTAARAVGPRFASQGRLLRTVLMPLLELLGDPSPPVAAAADTALQSICVHCGYGGSLTSLLGANADYVVDSLCARLRDLQHHPRAPHLLAALLQRAGVAPQLLPLMAEPLQRTLQGLSPLARHWAPHYAHSYIAVLRELTLGAAAEAAAAAEASRREVAELNRMAAEVREREMASEASVETVAGLTSDGTSAEASALGHENVKRFFMEHHGANGRAGGAEVEERTQRRLLTLTEQQLEESELRFRRLRAAAVVAGAAADAATPLLMYSDLHAAVTASDVLRSGLSALAAATPAVEAEAAVMEEYGGTAARMRPVRPEPPKVLPAVATVWGPLMAALRDTRTPVVERGVAAVAELVAVAGGAFLARRFQQEAWPVLQRLLTHGSAHTPGMLSLGTDASHNAPRRRLEIGGSTAGNGSMVSGGEDTALAPAAIARVRVATLRCLEAVCRCSDAGAVVRTLTWGIAQAALPFLAASHPPPLHEAAQATLLAVAALDPDGVWLLLYDASSNLPSSLTTAATGRQHVAEPRLSGLGGASGVLVPPGPSFPPVRALLPPLPSSSAGRLSIGASSAQHPQQWPVTTTVATDCGARAQSLLAAVALLEAPWHGTKIPALNIDLE
ncbi:hypothetical protein Vafri_19550 [Volvox africanus]|uniref:Uncharacterized protein n=1 Tax=Volvox africanus TaxID=51714 RepID=A0A8J4BQP0_9CHLO|nr:hypothetical protein Vafri_19550 [Volvox africanus]